MAPVMMEWKELDDVRVKKDTLGCVSEWMIFEI